MRSRGRAWIRATLDAKLAPIARTWQRDMAYVKFEIELRVFDPIGVIEIERHMDNLLPEATRQMKSTLDVGKDALEGHPPVGR